MSQFTPAKLNFGLPSQCRSATDIAGIYSGDKWVFACKKYDDEAQTILSAIPANPVSKFFLKADDIAPIDLSAYCAFAGTPSAPEWPFTIIVPGSITATLTAPLYQYDVQVWAEQTLIFGTMSVQTQVST